MFDKEGYNCPKCGASASGRKRRMTNECGQQKRLDDRKKANYIGSPQVFALEQACRSINEAFDGYGCYLVGSCIERPDWRDVDVRFIMPDDRFAVLFPKAGQCWEQDARWLLLTVAISERLSKVTGLPIDFQIQPQTHANERHKGPRHSIGLVI